MTRFNLSSRDPDSWSAAVSRNLSVLVAEGNIASAGQFSVGMIVFKDPGVTGVGAASVGGLPGSKAGCSWALDIVEETGVVGVALDVPKEEDTRDGATVVGGEKNVPSSSVSRKSLINKLDICKIAENSQGTYVRTENSLPKLPW